MTIYDNLRKGAALTAVEFSSSKEGNFAFFHIDRPAQKVAVRKWLIEQAGQEIVADTVVDGHPVFVTRGTKTQAEIMQQLADTGEHLTLHNAKEPVNLWKLRSIASVAGQTLQMVSAAAKLTYDPVTSTWARKGIEVPTMMFAVLNMGANVMGYLLGSQKSEDKYHLTYLKDQSNRRLEPHLLPDQALPDVADNRTLLREGPPPPKTIWQQFTGFLKRNSVVIGEIGMRYVAAIGLVFPIANKEKWYGGWQNIGKNLGKGEFKKAWAEGVNPSKFMRMAGFGYLIGKFIALFTKVKDPYEPKEHTWVDTLREDILFKVGSIIEAGAGTAIAYNGFKKGRIEIGGKQMPDYAGGVGGLIFATGYLIRLGAKFGEKQLDMKELQAHVSDSLAHVEPDKVPQLVAESAAALKDHLKGKPLEFGTIYTQMISDLHQHHSNALATLQSEVATSAPETKTASVATSHSEPSPTPEKPQPGAEAKVQEIPGHHEGQAVAESIGHEKKAEAKVHEIPERHAHAAHHEAEEEKSDHVAHGAKIRALSEHPPLHDKPLSSVSHIEKTPHESKTEQLGMRA